MTQPRIFYQGKWLNVQNDGHDTKTAIDQYVGVGDELQSRGIERPEEPINNSNGNLGT